MLFRSSACGAAGTASSSKGEDTQKETTEADQEKEDAESEAPEETEEESAESEEEAEETIYNIGDSASLKDWEISVTDMQIVESISAAYGSFSPDEGKYIQVFVTVVNNGKQADSFLPSIGMGDDVGAKIFFGDGYEFSSTYLLGYENEMHDSTLNPLSSKSGEIIFKVPEAVSDSEDELLMHFISGSDTLVFKIR